MPHILLAYLAIGLQRGLDGALRLSQTRVDLPLIAAMYFAACLPRATGPIAAALVGLADDLAGNGPIGLHALCFGLGGFVTARLPANRPLRMAIAVLAGVVVSGTLRVVLVGVRFVYVGEPRAYFWGWPGTILLTGVVTLALSPLLFKWRRPFVIRERNF